MAAEKILLKNLLSLMDLDMIVDIQYFKCNHFYKASGVYPAHKINEQLTDEQKSAVVSKILHGSISLVIQVDL